MKVCYAVERCFDSERDGTMTSPEMDGPGLYSIDPLQGRVDGG